MSRSSHACSSYTSSASGCCKDSAPELLLNDVSPLFTSPSAVQNANQFSSFSLPLPTLSGSSVPTLPRLWADYPLEEFFSTLSNTSEQTLLQPDIVTLHPTSDDISIDGIPVPRRQGPHASASSTFLLSAVSARISKKRRASEKSNPPSFPKLTDLKWDMCAKLLSSPTADATSPLAASLSLLRLPLYPWMHEYLLLECEGP
ncbi:hypothetical protein O6H91_22G019100 [Diphasiastrum complanatum]|uniref:Uncharacterized protein n=1 Tax=Diphasiastrum complanatum TaxID=34168 RepID=A0ACC2ADD0_DIPCM|nr:hypothetical protein O6H91_22G019100 [Diphasiastrum complanatum]